MELACLDLEGVLIPEIWIAFAKHSGIDALKDTTRDIPDYDVLMKQRLRILSENNLKLKDIEGVVSELSPLPGAKDFLYWLKERFQVVILSDTFYEFAGPLMKQLDYPTLFCHKLIVDSEGRVTDYKLRQKDQKREAIKAFHKLNFRAIAAGDSYNDINMLLEADAGILFSPPQNVIDEYPELPVTMNYEELKAQFIEKSERF